MNATIALVTPSLQAVTPLAIATAEVVAAHQAAEAEYQSWRVHMLIERDLYCPDGWRHDEWPLPHTSMADGIADPRGYYSRCARCGHHSMFPF